MPLSIGLLDTWPKFYEYNNKDEDNSLNTLNDKNYQASSFEQITCFSVFNFHIGYFEKPAAVYLNFFKILKTIVIDSPISKDNF